MQGDQTLLAVRFGRDGAARLAQSLFGQGVVAQENRGFGVNQAQTAQQAFGGVGCTGGVTALEVEVDRVERLDLLFELGNGHWDCDGDHRLVSNVRAQVGNGECAAAAGQEQGGQAGADGFGVTRQPTGQGLAAGGEHGVLPVEPAQHALRAHQQCAEHSSAQEQNTDQQGGQPRLESNKKRHQFKGVWRWVWSNQARAQGSKSGRPKMGHP